MFQQGMNMDSPKIKRKISLIKRYKHVVKLYRDESVSFIEIEGIQNA